MYLLINIIHFLSKFWNIKRVVGYLFCTGRYVTCIIISSIISNVKWYKIFPDITLNLVSYLYLLIINIPLLSKFWNIKQVAWYSFCKGRNVTRIIISSIICHVRWYQIFPDITLNLVSYLYLLIFNIPLLSKFWNIKRVAGYLFCTGRNVTRITISSIIRHVRWYQIFPDITLNLLSYMLLLIINIRFCQ